jgi:hypothetical protein
MCQTLSFDSAGVMWKPGRERVGTGTTVIEAI